eukprot:2284566-Pyramimonas_sp.AAC.1
MSSSGPRDPNGTSPGRSSPRSQGPQGSQAHHATGHSPGLRLPPGLYPSPALARLGGQVGQRSRRGRRFFLDVVSGE